MKLARSGSRGVFWRASARGTQELKLQQGVRQRGDWWVRWKCGFRHLHRQRVGPKSGAQREAERHRLQRDCPDREQRPQQHLVRDAVNEYLATSKVMKRSYKDDARYGAMWIDRFGACSLDEITPERLGKVQAERAAQVKAATVNREFAFLKHVFNVAVRNDRLARNPFDRVPLLREPTGRVRYLTDEEETRLRRALPGDEDRDRLSFLLHTNLRKADFLGLRWHDVDVKNGIVTIPRTKNGDARRVELNAEASAILRRRARPLDRSALVFPNSLGCRDLRWVEKTFPRAVAAAQIDDLRFHDLRHTFASRLRMEGVDILTIKELGGWKSLKMVERYSHIGADHRRAAIERLATRSSRLEEQTAAAQ